MVRCFAEQSLEPRGWARGDPVSRPPPFEASHLRVRATGEAADCGSRCRRNQRGISASRCGVDADVAFVLQAAGFGCIGEERQDGTFAASNDLADLGKGLSVTEPG